MPAIPRFAPRTEIGMVPQARIGAEAFSTAANAQAQTAAAGVTFANTLSETARENATTQGRIQVTERLGALRAELDREPDATRISERWRSESQQIISEIGGSLPWNARSDFNNFARLDVAREGRSVDQLAGTRATEQTLATISQRGQQLAQQATDPRMAATARAEYDGLIATAVGNGTLRADRAETLRQRFGSDVAEAAALQMGISNPGGAARLLADPNGPFRDMQPDARARMAMSLASRADSMAARAEAAAGRRERQIALAISGFDQTLAAGVVPSGAEFQRAQELARGTPYEARLATMVTDARAVAEFASLPLAQQQERLEVLRGQVQTGRTGATADATLAQYQRLAGIVQQQQRDYRTDGLTRGVRDGVIEALPPIDLNNPETINARVAAAQAMSARAGMPISAITTDDARQMAQTFERATPEAQVPMIVAITRIADPAVRQATLQHLESVRGEGARLPAGTLMRVAYLAQTDPRGATNLLSLLQTQTTDRVIPPGQAQQVRSAMESAMTTGILGVRAAQAQRTGFGGYTQELNLDLTLIERTANAYMSAGVPADRAVTQAIALINGGRAGLNDPRLASVAFPAAQATEATMRQGLTVLRERAAAGVTVPSGEGASSEATVTARELRAATANGVWINDGQGYALTERRGDGTVRVVARASLQDVTAAAAGAATQQREQARTEATVEGRAAASRTQAPNVVPPPTPLGTSRRRPEPAAPRLQ